MHDVILTSDDGNYRVSAYPDTAPESPRWDAEFGVMYCRHPRYSLGDKGDLLTEVDTRLADEGRRRTLRWLVEEHGTTVVLPLFLHDHSGLSMSAGANLIATGGDLEMLGDRWDTSLVGIIFDTAERRQDWVGESEEVLRREVRDYDLFLRGEIYTLLVEQKVLVYTETRATYPDGTVESSDQTEVRWESYPEAGATTAWGDSEFGSIAADMLNEILVVQAGV